MYYELNNTDKPLLHTHIEELAPGLMPRPPWRYVFLESKSIISTNRNTQVWPCMYDTQIL